jgi:hypothetical protein
MQHHQTHISAGEQSMNIVNYVQVWVKSGEVWAGKRMPVDHIVCKDGFTFSVQASSSHYCTPRSDDAHAYTNFEVGFPSILEESLAPYAETPGTTETVFGWVPLRVIVYLIDKHGGVLVNTQEA